jgi:hypothetical protein
MFKLIFATAALVIPAVFLVVSPAFQSVYP